MYSDSVGRAGAAGEGRPVSGEPAPAVSPEVLLWTVEQAAGLLQVPVSWLARKASQRAVPCTFLGKHLRFSRSDLDAIIAAGRSEPVAGRQQASPDR